MRGHLSEERKCFPTQCSKCGASVFYYSDENGGKVFFEILGGDWPKHDCQSDFGHAISDLKQTSILSLFRKPKKGIRRIIKRTSKEGKRLAKLAAAVNLATANRNKRKKGKKNKKT